ncbi:preprotein translocase subunit SecG [Thioclava sp. SK-1]|uniref:preprotein translocase subunit SecG n=1 Tax=Thioclava sp. SK-1 TaxID=1889770 RepID=UPI00082435D0|nr:preprotein translocase subunit SecG [Thioclava sp. SK-1]OCX64636.1 preprotein translocase subunit SecG [Thioclava sp. SK-1]
MQTVVLSIHLILALLMIGVVLLQRSEGGGLGMGDSGGGAGNGVMTGRQAANALSKLTWILAAGFLATSITLTVLAARDAQNGSVVDLMPATDGSAPALPSVDLTPPPASTNAPITPPAAE